MRKGGGTAGITCSRLIGYSKLPGFTKRGKTGREARSKDRARGEIKVWGDRGIGKYSGTDDRTVDTLEVAFVCNRKSIAAGRFFIHKPGDSMYSRQRG